MLTYIIWLVLWLLVFYIFSIKYWSLAYKIELAVNEKDIMQKNLQISILLNCGIILICLLAPFGAVLDIAEH